MAHIKMDGSENVEKLYTKLTMKKAGKCRGREQGKGRAGGRREGGNSSRKWDSATLQASELSLETFVAIWLPQTSDTAVGGGGKASEGCRS